MWNGCKIYGKIVDDVMRRYPFTNCVGCDRPIEEIGGRRILHSRRGGIILLHNDNDFNFTNIGNSFSMVINVDDERNIFAWGPFTFIQNIAWESKLNEIVRMITEEKLRPWVCQSCIKYTVCKKCDAPLNRVPYSVVLDENGQQLFFGYDEVERLCPKGCE